MHVFLACAVAWGPWDGGAATSATIRLQAQSVFQPGDGVAFDDPSFNVGPAPGTAAWLGIAAGRRGRRRRARCDAAAGSSGECVGCTRLVTFRRRCSPLLLVCGGMIAAVRPYTGLLVAAVGLMIASVMLAKWTGAAFACAKPRRSPPGDAATLVSSGGAEQMPETED
jgi:hypothetical protein